MSYSLLHTLHLLGAIAFIGTLFFEVIILAKVKPQLAPGALVELEQALGKRTRTVLHWVVLLVYGAGFGLAWQHRQALSDPFASSFATLLSLKIVLAVSLFLSFGLVAMLLRSGRMTPSLYRKLHWAVLAQMLGIVLLAKGMFYIQW
ncbi:CopD family copper resistance protein [Pseudomonas sp. EA_105y_Pfl2_R69]|uniref:CopD family copper resistance protein n=1 Tax=Pseudomonas sp. EA_105y_Pfl2_R69 TaxID=3088683 RepID=UPI0030D8E157